MGIEEHINRPEDLVGSSDINKPNLNIENLEVLKQAIGPNIDAKLDEDIVQETQQQLFVSSGPQPGRLHNEEMDKEFEEGEVGINGDEERSVKHTLTQESVNNVLVDERENEVMIEEEEMTDVEEEDMIGALTENFQQEEEDSGGEEWGRTLSMFGVELQQPELEVGGSIRDKGKRAEVVGASEMLRTQRKSARQNLMWGDKTIGTKDLIAAAVKAKTPLPARVGMSSDETSILNLINDAILVQLASIGGISLGNNELTVHNNIKMMKGWEKARHAWWAKNRKKLEPIVEENANDLS